MLVGKYKLNSKIEKETQTGIAQTTLKKEEN